MENFWLVMCFLWLGVFCFNMKWFWMGKWLRWFFLCWMVCCGWDVRMGFFCEKIVWEVVFFWWGLVW